VGTVFSGEGIEVVWVRKAGERIDPEWFVPESVDLLTVLRGRLRVEFKDRRWRTRVLEPGDVLVLPRSTACRAYRWPRTSRAPTVFLATYPKRSLHRRND